MASDATAAGRVAVISDVHGNAVALAAVLAELAAEPPDLVVFGGDLTWGPQPRETLEHVQALQAPFVLVRGNAERALFELRADPSRERRPREQWLVDLHTEADIAFLEEAVDGSSVDVAGSARCASATGRRAATRS